MSLLMQTNVGFLNSIAGKNEQLFPNSEKFDPERWARDKPNPFAVLSFGFGARNCYGKLPTALYLLCLLCMCVCLMYICVCNLASSPRPLPVFNVACRKREGAWYLIPRDSRNDDFA